MTEEPRFENLKVEFVHTLYDSNQHLIYVADRKVAALLLINGVLVSLSGTWDLREYPGSIKAIILLAILFAAASTILYLLAIIPRISEQAPKSILHYEGILQRPADQYLCQMAEMREADFIKDYLQTIYALSSIQMKKNRYLRRGSESLMLSIILLAVAFVLHSVW